VEQYIRGLPNLFVPLINDLNEDFQNITARYGKVSSPVDVRVSCIGRMLTQCTITQIKLMFLAEQMLDPKWWAHPGREHFRVEHLDPMLTEFENNVKFSIIMFYLSNVENFIRSVVRTIGTGDLKPTAPFANFCDKLLNYYLIAQPADASALLKMARLLRNTVHTNSVYVSANGADEAVLWRGTSYPFEHDKPVEFATWEFLIEYFDVLRGLCLEIISDPFLANFTDPIPDLYVETYPVTSSGIVSERKINVRCDACNGSGKLAIALNGVCPDCKGAGGMPWTMTHERLPRTE
jgi:hypothetical protein